MHNKRGVALKVLIIILVIIVIIHSIFHIIFFKTNLSLVNTLGMSGMAIGEVPAAEIENQIRTNSSYSLPSAIIIAAEWLLLFALIVLSFIRSHLEHSKDKIVHLELLSKKNKSDTDIDILYEILQKNKKVTVSQVSELFKVDKKVVEEWGEILEHNDLAVVDYPRFGEIEIRLKDETA